MELVIPPVPRKVYVHPAGERECDGKVLSSKVAFRQVPNNIADWPSFVQWLKENGVNEILHRDGWMEIPTHEACANWSPLPAEFACHVRKESPPPQMSAAPIFLFTTPAAISVEPTRALGDSQLRSQLQDDPADSDHSEEPLSSSDSGALADRNGEYRYDYEKKRWCCTVGSCSKNYGKRIELEKHRMRQHALHDPVMPARKGRAPKHASGPLQPFRDYSKRQLERSFDVEWRYEHNLKRNVLRWRNAATKFAHELVASGLACEEERETWVEKYVEGKRAAYEGEKEKHLEALKQHIRDGFNLEGVEENEWCQSSWL